VALKRWPKHEHIIKEIGIEKDSVVSKWERQVAKDGTSRMRLICIEVDGRPFQECIRGEILGATEGMVSEVCNLGKVRKEKADFICVDSQAI